MKSKLKEGMIMSLSNSGFAEKSFKVLSDSISESDKLMIETRLLMYRFLSEIDKITSERGINRKELAKLTRTSASYITQLYQGKKIINLQMLTRIKKALDIDFKIEVVHSEERIKKDCRELIAKQIAPAIGKRAAHVMVHGSPLSGKLIQAKSSKSERRPQKTL
jgi:transcriptional regulator with XRE-family HTH domain